METLPVPPELLEFWEDIAGLSVWELREMRGEAVAAEPSTVFGHDGRVIALVLVESALRQRGADFIPLVTVH